LPDGAAGVIADALIAQPLVSSQPAALFHADPHAGNLLLLPENRVGILDWSLTGRLSRRERVALVQLLIGGWTLDLGRMERAVEQLGSQSPTRSATTGVLQAALHALHWPGVPGVAWLRALLDRLVLRAGVRFKTNLLLFRKTLLTLEGVLADLCQDPEAVLDAAVAAAFLNHWTAEWPAQILAPWSTRSLTTHLSTSDLFSLAWSGPATLTRWSVGSWNWNNENIGIME
jgi:ubiquinone biosynthesis protein